MNKEIGPLISIQYLRAFAALMVVVHHARNPFKGFFNPLSDSAFNAWGVDIFFIISGFIMYLTARHQDYLKFSIRRIARLVPLYWIGTIILTVYIVLFKSEISRMWIFWSLAFIPFENPLHNGNIWPLLVPGWTLNLEMFFYALFAIGLAINRLKFFLSIVIIFLVVMGFIFDFDNPIIKTYTMPLMLEFLTGFWIAKIWISRQQFFIHLWPLLPTGLVLFPAIEWLGAPSILPGFLPALAVVLGALSVEARNQVPDISSAKLLGDASYSIYIIHTIVLVLIKRLVMSLPLEGWPQFFTMIVLALTFSSVVGIAVYRWIEKPLLVWTMPLTRLPILNRA